MKLSRRKLLLGGAASIMWPHLNIPASAAPLKYNLKAQKVTDNTYLVHGKMENFTMQNGGHIVNIAFVDTEEGVVLIDTGPSFRYGKALKKLIKKVTGKEVVRAYITHYHPDHCLGNQAFDTKTIAATKKMIDDLKTSGEDFLSNMFRLLGDWMRDTEVVLPATVITSSSEKFGSHRFELIPMQGHTDSDLVILDHKTNTLFAGDLCFLDRAATTPHADISKWQKSLKQIKAIPHKALLPGHGPVDLNGRAIEQTYDYITWLEKSFIESINRGDDMNQAAKIQIPDQFKSIELVHEEIERSVAHLFPKLEEKLLPFVGQGG